MEALTNLTQTFQASHCALLMWPPYGVSGGFRGGGGGGGGKGGAMHPSLAASNGFLRT